jgi:hypothetical protein
MVALTSTLRGFLGGASYGAIVDYRPLGITGDLKYRNGGRSPTVVVVFWARENATIIMGPFLNSIPVIHS